MRGQPWISGVRQISLTMFRIVRYSSQAWWSPNTLVKWVLLNAQMTGPIFAPAGRESCVSHHQSPVFISQLIWWLSMMARCSASTSRCASNKTYATRKCIYLTITLWYTVPRILEWCSIPSSSPSPKLTSERNICRVSGNWNVWIMKLTSPWLKNWSLNVFVCGLIDRVCWNSCAERPGCHGFCCFQYVQILWYNPVTLWFGFPPAFSTATTHL